MESVLSVICPEVPDTPVMINQASGLLSTAFVSAVTYRQHVVKVAQGIL